MSIREAFAGDDVVEEFEKEKEELEREAMKPDVPAVLPGKIGCKDNFVVGFDLALRLKNLSIRTKLVRSM